MRRSNCSTRVFPGHILWITQPSLPRSNSGIREFHRNYPLVVMAVLAFLVILSTFSKYANAQEYFVEIITRIDDGDPVPGMKSSHRIAVDFKTRTLRRVHVKTGTTYGIPSTRNKFSENIVGWDACGRGGVPTDCVKIQLKGSTASGVRVIPNIDYDLSVYVTHDGLAAIRGCHDGYPTYLVRINERVLYHFKHQPWEIWRLSNFFGKDCHVRANGHIGDWEGS